MNTDKIQVLIVDDHIVMREGLSALINPWTNMEVIGEAANGCEAIEKSRSLRPDVIIMDLIMPGMSGVEAIKEIIRENRHSKVLVLTSYSEENKVIPAIQAGALGYGAWGIPPWFCTGKPVRGRTGAMSFLGSIGCPKVAITHLPLSV